MKSLKTTIQCLLAAALVAPEVSGAAAAWDYNANGADWGALTEPYAGCAAALQSPIDLQSSAPTVGAATDMYQKHYQNVKDVELTIDNSTNLAHIDLNYNKKYPRQYFHSKMKPDIAELFVAQSMSFHAKSQHTIDGKQFDLEITINHQDPTKVSNTKSSAALSILFNLNDYNEKVSDSTVAYIDKFFESLNLNTSNTPYAKSKEVMMGELLAVLDTSNRYVYQGSMTTPPCQAGIYWNVLSTVYPIKEDHLDQVRRFLATDPKLKKGNFRKIQPAESRTVQKVFMERPDVSDPTVTNDFQQVLYDLFIAIIVCWVVLLIGGAFYWGYKQFKANQAPEQHVEQKGGNKLEDLYADGEKDNTAVQQN